MVEAAPKETSQRLAVEQFWLKTQDEDGIQMHGVLPLPGNLAAVFYNSSKVQVFDFKRDSTTAGWQNHDWDQDTVCPEADRLLRPVLEIPAPAAAQQPKQDEQSGVGTDARIKPFLFYGKIFGWVDTVNKRLEFVNVQDGYNEAQTGFPRVEVPTATARGLVGTDAKNVDTYFKNALRVVSLPDTRTLVVVEVLNVIQNQKEIILTAFSPDGSQKQSRIGVKENVMYHVTRFNYSNKVGFYHSSPQDNKINLFLWDINKDAPVKIEFDPTFNGTLIDVQPLDNDRLYLVGGYGNFKETKEGKEEDVQYLVNRIVDLSAVEYTGDEGKVQSLTFQAQAIADLDEEYVLYGVPEGAEQTSKRRTFALAELRGANRFNQNLVFESRSNEETFLVVVPLKRLEAHLQKLPEGAPRTIPINLLTYFHQYDIPGQTANGVHQVVVASDDGASYVGYEEDQRANKEIRFYYYHFVSHKDSLTWLVKEAFIDKLFGVPGIVNGIASKLVFEDDLKAQ